MENTKEYFNQYSALSTAIKGLERRMRYYEKHPLVSSHGVVKSSMKKHPYCETHVVVSGSDLKSDSDRSKKMNEIYFSIMENKKQLENKKLEIEALIQSIKNPEDLAIMQMKFVEGWTDSEIGEELGYERSVINRKISKIIESL